LLCGNDLNQMESDLSDGMKLARCIPRSHPVAGQ
jgi:hypothetical protein